MKRHPTIAALASIIGCILFSHVSAQEWARFRGPNGSGVSTEAGFPAMVSRDGDVAWRSPVRPGKSSPVLSRRHVFVVAFDDGQFFTQCFDRASGRLVWERAEARPRRAPAHRFKDAAAATPVTESPQGTASARRLSKSSPCRRPAPASVRTRSSTGLAPARCRSQRRSPRARHGATQRAGAPGLRGADHPYGGTSASWSSSSSAVRGPRSHSHNASEAPPANAADP